VNSKPHWSEDVLLVLSGLVTAGVVYGLVRLFSSPASIEGITLRITIATYAIAILVYVVIARGLFIGHVQGNGVPVTAGLFPELDAIVKRQSERLGLKKIPRVYVIQGGGVLNAFATKTLVRNYVVLYADIVEKAFEEGADVVEFVVAHELVHVRRRHVLKLMLTVPSVVLFPLRLAYSRACEFTCDRFAAELVPQGYEKALLLLAVGKKLYEKVDVEAYVQTLESDRSFWKSVAEFLSTHPILSRRIRQVRRASSDPQAAGR
jgi:Zn-dependent protease with chaperone function